MNLTATRPCPVPAPHSVASRATPTWFGEPDRALFGWVHAPTSTPARGAAVLCAPLFREQDVAAYTLRRLALELAERGVLAIRFDYHGTGDSSGEDDEPGRVAAWQDSVAQAVTLAKDCGATSVTLVGMRAGALLAASMAQLAGVGALVAWDPCESGRQFVRQQRALHRLSFGENASGSDTVEVPGFVVANETAGALNHLAPKVRGSAITHALVLTRPSTPIPSELASDLEGCVLDRCAAIGQADLLEGNGERQRVPLSTISQIAHWVQRRCGDGQFAPSVPATRPLVLEHPDANPITETAVRLGPSQLFAIADRAGGGHRRAGRGLHQ